MGGFVGWVWGITSVTVNPGCVGVLVHVLRTAGWTGGLGTVLRLLDRSTGALQLLPRFVTTPSNLSLLSNHTCCFFDQELLIGCHWRGPTLPP